MSRAIVRRFLHTLLVMLGAVTLVFILLNIAPGDPVDRMAASPYATQEDLARMKATYGMDKPVVQRYFVMLYNMARGDFGRSFFHHQDTLPLVLERLPATAELALAGIFVTVLIALPAGLISALRRNRPEDYLASAVMFIGQATPQFWLGLVLIVVFSTQLGWLPTFGRGPSLAAGLAGVLTGQPGQFWEALRYLLLPAFTLGIYFSSVIGQLTRGQMIEGMRQDYVRVLRAKGVRERVIVWAHVLKNAAIPVVTVLGLQLGALLGGTVVVEAVFSWPGVGSLLVGAISQRDYPVVQAVVVVVSLGYVLINLCVDLIHMYLDPRVRI